MDGIIKSNEKTDYLPVAEAEEGEKRPAWPQA